jgi:hypothetical protein
MHCVRRCFTFPEVYVLQPNDCCYRLDKYVKRIERVRSAHEFHDTGFELHLPRVCLFPYLLPKQIEYVLICIGHVST